MNKNSMGKKLLNMRDAISGVENTPEIQTMLDEYGYTRERMVEGRQLLDQATELMTIQVGEYSDKYVASSEFSKFWDKTYSKYMVTLKVVRVAFIDQPEILYRFSATGSRNRSLSGWLKDARVLYANLLRSPESLEIMRQYGYTVERLDKEYQDVLEVEQLRSIQLKEKGMAQHSTRERDEAFDALCKWFSKFRAIARVALYDKPQFLEALGIVKK
jgi:hypothetical protein